MPQWAGQRTDEPFDVRAFIESRAAPADNAAPLYVEALSPICRYLEGEEDSPVEAEIRQLAVVEKLAEEQVEAQQVDSQQVDDVLRKTAPILAQVDAAQLKPRCVFVVPFRADALAPHALAMRNVSRLAILQLEQSRRTGDFELAAAAIRRSLRASRDLQPRGHSAIQFVSVAMDGQILTGIERFTLADPSLTAGQIDQLLELLADHQQQMLPRANEGLKVDFIQSRNSIEDIESGRLTIDEVVEFLSGHREPSDEFASSGPPKFNYETEAAACNQLYQTAIAAAGEWPCSSPNTAMLRAELERRSAAIEAFKQTAAATPADKKSQLRDAAPSFLYWLWVASAEPLIVADRRAAAQLNSLQMLLALRRYEIAHGALPDRLEDAAAECALKTVPADPYDGRPLRFATVEGEPIVYSVGKDCTDDGGKLDWDFGRQPGDYRFVLPRTTQ